MVDEVTIVGTFLGKNNEKDTKKKKKISCGFQAIGLWYWPLFRAYWIRKSVEIVCLDLVVIGPIIAEWGDDIYSAHAVFLKYAYEV